ncbi:MAG TPA: acyl-CoA dehydrogenase family protein [Acidimicrobiia bacterium]
MTGGRPLELDEFRSQLATWLDDRPALLDRQRTCFSLELTEVVDVQRELQEELFAGGWVRHGWPEALGGLGGDARHRAVLYDELGVRRVAIPESYLTVETLVPMLSVHAPDLAQRHLADLLRGAERWCQGFSEPDAGSDLASLRTKAVRDGDDWVVDGHKIWTSQATVSQRCVVLLRTGTQESRHRGLSMLLVDHETAGVEVRPIRTMSGRDELGEVLFDGARVPGDRLIGEPGDGWALAMYLLQWERGMYPWQRQAGLLATLDQLVARAGEAIDPRALADAYLSVLPMRLSAGHTIRRLAAGEMPGPEVSVDKVLLARAELAVFDLADTVLDGDVELGDDADDAEWRHDWLFSRSAPIYGGSYEIQRQILAERVLGLPRG